MSAAHDVSYSSALVEAVKQYVRNPSRLTVEQWQLLAKYSTKHPFIERAAEILLDLLEGAEVHDDQKPSNQKP